MSDEKTTRTIAPLFTWRSAIAESDLPPTTRHVLLTLSTYMNERGGSAYPGSARLANDSGLHQSTVKAHLATAARTGWLRIVRKGSALKGQPRLATEYVAAVPVDNGPGVQDTQSFESTDGGSSPRGPGVQDAPITSLNSPENSRLGGPNDKAPDDACVRCHGRGIVPQDRRCSCTFVVDPALLLIEQP